MSAGAGVMSAQLRVFFAHPKSMPDDEIDRWQHGIAGIFKDAGYSSVDVVAGRDDFNKYSMSAGSFTAWAREVAQRRDMGTGKPVYGAFVSVNAYVGRATADILDGALRIGTPVVYVEPKEDGSTETHAVRGVVVVDPDDYLKGWCLDT